MEVDLNEITDQLLVMGQIWDEWAECINKAWEVLDNHNYGNWYGINTI